MSSVLDRSSLEQSPLADLHLLANELGVDGFRRLRKPELVDAILARQSGAAAGAEVVDADAEAEADARTEAEAEAEADAGIEAEADAGTEAEAEVEVAPETDAHEAAGVVEDVEAASVVGEEPAEEEQEAPKRARRSRRGGRSRARTRAEEGAEDTDRAEAAAPLAAPEDEDDAEAETEGVAEPADAVAETVSGEPVAEGVVELLANGSGFIRLAPPETTDDDVYVSAAQVKRCELVSGDRVSGPVRPPRRSERFPSLIRVDTINGRPADEVAEGTRFEDLAVDWPHERLELGTDDPTIKAIEWLTPFGKGSRVTIAGPHRSGKTEALHRIAHALAGRDGLEVSAVLCGVRPEELADWSESPVPVVSALTFAASADALAQALEQAVEQGRRVAARGGDALLIVDSLDLVPRPAARRAMAAARNLADSGSLTIIATSEAPVGGETTVVTLDPVQAGLGRFPALVLAQSGTLRPELLVSEAGAQAIRSARAEHA